MTALLAALFERVFGYPQKLVDAIGHPVIWMGWLIGAADENFNNPRAGFEQRRMAGAIALGVVLAVVGFITIQISAVANWFAVGWVVEVLLASSLIAQKGLRDAVCAVAISLRTGTLEEARWAVGQIVGRDTQDLEEDEISRAAIETLAENTSDGVVAPLFYLALFGLPGAALYKAINTADSMIGHKSDKYAAFGWAAAKLDDIANFIPARLTALIFAGAAALMSGANPKAGWQAAQRDAGHHASPNAGWPEAAMAGALGFGLGGARAYDGRTLDLPQMGGGRRELGAEDIASAVALYDRSLWLIWGVLAVVALMGF